MDAVGEEKPLGIDGEVLEISAFTVTFIFIENILDHVPDREVPLAVLVPGDVAAQLGGLRKMVGIFLLPETEVVPSRNPETDYLEVGELVQKVMEVSVLCLLFPLRARAESGSRSDCENHLYS